MVQLKVVDLKYTQRAHCALQQFTISTMLANEPLPDSSASVRDSHDLERQSIHSESSIGSHEIADIQTGPKDKTLTDRGDVEAYPTAAAEGMWRTETAKSNRGGRLGGIMSRLSTKSSWIDPGPPPDGGKQAWIQGMRKYYCVHIAIY